MLKRKGKLGIVGLPPGGNNIPNIKTLDIIRLSDRDVFGSLLGGIKETQEMLDYSVAHGIYPEVEMIPATPASVDQAFQNVSLGKVKFRYVIDMKTLE